MTNAEHTPLFRQPDQPLAARAADLLGRLTDDEKLAMLHQVSPAIERLGVGAFRTGCEALHGVGWLGTATVFPQAVGLAATWDTALVEAAGEVAGTEVRAKRAENPEVSLNVWAPVVNTLRHPGWGRNEEGYSEDPHVTGLFGAAFARGLRGGHERVWRTVPTLKHFLGYNNETDRSVTNSNLSNRTLHEEELPAFRAAIEEGAAGAMMLSYNLVNGSPAHVQPELVAEARRWSDESIAVVSDAGAPSMLVSAQHFRDDTIAGAAAMVRAGLDSFTDDDADSGPTIANLRGTLEAGLLDWADIDTAVLRLLELRLRTGEFDGDADPYAGITAEDVDRPAARKLAREIAGAAVVVLRNDEALLPLAAPSRVLVAGPLADLVLTDWYSGTPPYAVGIAAGLRERYPDATVEVVTGADVVALRATSTGGYLGATPDGARVTARASEPEDRFEVTDWGDGVVTLRSATSGRLLSGGHWPVRADAERVGGWVVQETFRRHVHADGTVSFLHLGSGRWLRVMVNGVLAADGVELRHAERFRVRTLSSGTAELARAAAAADVVVVAVGNDPHLLGRETEDRPHLYLPESMAELWRTVHGANPTAVLAIVSSYPYVLPDGVADAPTVVWSSHGGQELGHGLADVLSGDWEPRGRLAQSWPAHPGQAGDLLDYDTLTQQATYRHQPEPYAFAFGHGCTYGEVSYDVVELAGAAPTAPVPTLRHAAFTARVDEATVTATVRVSNTGGRAAEELVQLYALPPARPGAPRRLLVAFERVRLEPRESRAVELAFPVTRLSVWDESARVPGAPDGDLYAGALVVHPGDYVLAAGPDADHLLVRSTLTITPAG
ncbi:glycoside hydrolase family 3 C-terminal domain-containing protein [Tessaracoccus terricola]